MNSEHMLTCSHEDYANLHGTMCLILVFFCRCGWCLYLQFEVMQETVSHLSSSWLDSVYFLKHYLSRDDATCLFVFFHIQLVPVHLITFRNSWTSLWTADDMKRWHWRLYWCFLNVKVILHNGGEQTHLPWWKIQRYPLVPWNLKKQPRQCFGGEKNRQGRGAPETHKRDRPTILLQGIRTWELYGASLLVGAP